MNDIQSLAIENQLDIIEARMRVRLLARDSGLDLFDQARISLATSPWPSSWGWKRRPPASSPCTAW